MEIINLFRNLNQAKKDPSKFVWSAWHGSSKAPGKLAKGRADGGHLRGRVVLANATACYSANTVKRMQERRPNMLRADGSIKRTVFAWFRGQEVDAPSITKGRRVTLNHEKGNWTFVWSDGRTACPSSFAYIIADSTGCYEGIAK